MPTPDSTQHSGASQCVGSGKCWVLSEYDSQRERHDPITDDTVLELPSRALSSELMCPICMDMLRNTMTTKECLHRFCQECITTALRSGNKECPTCRCKLISKRSLRPDPNFDGVISRIFPNREEYDAIQQRLMKRLSQYHSTESLQKNIEEGIRFQSRLRKLNRFTGSHSDDRERKRQRRRDIRSGTSSMSHDLSDAESSIEQSSEASANSSLDRQHSKEVGVIMRPHPDIERNDALPLYVRQIRYLKTSSAIATVSHLRRYVVMRIQMDGEKATRSNVDDHFDLSRPIGSVEVDERSDQCELFAMARNNHLIQICNGATTLETILSKYGRRRKLVELYFRLPTQYLLPDDANSVALCCLPVPGAEQNGTTSTD